MGFVNPDIVRKWIFPALAVILSLFGFLLVAELVLRLLPVRTAMVRLPVNVDHVLLRYRPNRSFTYSLHWNLTDVGRGRINNLGFVNDQDYDSTSTKPLLAVVGDSYVEAPMVRFAETTHGRLAALAKPQGRVYSFGISGASLAQYLAEADFARAHFRPSALVVMIVANDFDESLLRYRFVPGQHYFVEENGELRLTRLDYAPSMLRRLAGHSAVARYLLYNAGLSTLTAGLRAAPRHGEAGAAAFVGNTSAAADSQRLSDSRRVVDAFLTDLPGRAGLPRDRILLVLDGTRPQLYDPEDLRRTAGSYWPIMRDYVAMAAERLGYELVDLQPRFIARHQREGLIFEFPRDGHWNATGHAEAAAAVAEATVFRRWLNGAQPD